MEFEPGDRVTFNAWPDELIPAKVVSCLADGRYELHGTDQKKPLISITSGQCIRESRHFKCPIENPFVW